MGSGSKVASAVELKTVEEINRLRLAGQQAAELLQRLKKACVPGITAQALDELAARIIRELGATPAFLGYRGFPAHICVSVNEEVVHGIPGPRVIRAGDLVSLDVGVFYQGFCGDTATSFGVGTMSATAERLLTVAEEALERAIQAARVGARLGDVSYAMQSTAEVAGFHVIREYGGHGIGRAMHEEPHVPCVGQPGTGLRLQEGMVLALEVMVNVGTPHIRHLSDGWTVVTVDGSLSAHFEHMVALTASGPEVLTRSPSPSPSPLRGEG
ncbi:MAG: type I methionyl aminopeptidase [Elusimicrobia bacterium]|nr:type I methionyl aminopeptidase [Elusimicrobiota bacterium]